MGENEGGDAGGVGAIGRGGGDAGTSDSDSAKDSFSGTASGQGNHKDASHDPSLLETLSRVDKCLRLAFVTDVLAIKNTTLPIATPLASVLVESYNGSRIT